MISHKPGGSTLLQREAADSLLRFYELGLCTREQLVRQQILLGEATVEACLEQMKLLARADNLGDLVAGELALAGHWSETMVTAVQEALELQHRQWDKLFHWYHESLLAIWDNESIRGQRKLPADAASHRGQSS